MIASVIVLAKQPVPGRVKTRLSPPLRPEQAACVAAAALSDTLHVTATLPARTHLLAFDGPTNGWLPANWTACTQPRGGLDVRIAAAFGHAGPGPALLVGMDTPQVSAGQLAAFDSRAYDACLGPASDGGYWALGLRDPGVAARAVLGITMSSPRTGSEQLHRLEQLGLRVQLLDELTDVDTIDTAAQVAASAPDTEFAHAFAQCLDPAAVG